MASELAELFHVTAQLNSDSDVEYSNGNTQQFVFRKVEWHKWSATSRTSICSPDQDQNLKWLVSNREGTRNVNSIKGVRHIVCQMTHYTTNMQWKIELLKRKQANSHFISGHASLLYFIHFKACHFLILHSLQGVPFCNIPFISRCAIHFKANHCIILYSFQGIPWIIIHIISKGCSCLMCLLFFSVCSGGHHRKVNSSRRFYTEFTQGSGRLCNHNELANMVSGRLSNHN